LLERDEPELEGQVTGGATRTPGDVNEKGLELPHPLDALIEVLHDCARKSRKSLSRGGAFVLTCALLGTSYPCCACNITL
jgi:hypothetical protein